MRYLCAEIENGVQRFGLFNEYEKCYNKNKIV